MPAIQVQQMSRTFGEISAVDGLTFDVRQGEVFGCLGHNGAGKTTSVRLMNGVLHPSAGRLRVLGLDPVEAGHKLRRRTGVLTESPALDERLTARENLIVYAHLYEVPAAEVQGRVNELLARFGLVDRGDDKTGAYSKGMKQRLALARALIHRPELLFLDEPTAGLDPMAARDVHDLIQGLRAEGTTIFLCTHNLVEAQKVCDRVAVLQRGRLLGLGTIAELSQQLRGKLELEIEVDASEQDRALSFLRQHPASGHARLERGFLICQVNDRGQIPSLLEGLVEQGLAVYRLSPQEPSLEDIYFGLHAQGASR